MSLPAIPPQELPVGPPAHGSRRDAVLKLIPLISLSAVLHVAVVDTSFLVRLALLFLVYLVLTTRWPVFLYAWIALGLGAQLSLTTWLRGGVSSVTLWNLIQATTFLAVVVLIARYLEFHPRLFVASRRSLAQPRPPVSDRVQAEQSLSPFHGLAIRPLVAILAGSCLLAYFPVASFTGLPLGYVGPVVRTIFFLTLLGAVAVTLNTVFTANTWRRLGPQEAELFIKRAVADEVRSEQTAIELARIRYLYRKSKKR